MDDSLRALLEIMYERLGAAKVIFDKQSSSEEQIDFYVVEETLSPNLNDKRRILRKRRDVMLKVKTQAKQAV